MPNNEYDDPKGGPWLDWVLGLVLLLVLAFLMTSCCPCRHLTTSDNTKDSVRVVTVIRTEYIHDTVFIEIPVERERQTVRDTTSHLETSFALSDARINKDGTLYHSLENKPQKRPVEVEKEVIYRDSIVYRDKVVRKVQTVEVPRELTWWQRTQMRGFWVAIIIFAITYRKKIFQFGVRLFLKK